MPLHLDDTIAAVASPPGPAVRGIIRISGAEVVSPLNQLLDVPLPSGRLPQRIERCIQADEIGSPLPVAILLWPTNRKNLWSLFSDHEVQRRDYRKRNDKCDDVKRAFIVDTECFKRWSYQKCERGFPDIAKRK